MISSTFRHCPCARTGVCGLMTEKVDVNLNALEATIVENDSPQRNTKTWVKKFRKISLWTLVTLVILAVGTIGILYSMQKTFMYKPKRHGPGDKTPKNYGWHTHKEAHHPEDDDSWSWDTVKIQTPDKETLSCYWLKHLRTKQNDLDFSKKDLYTVVYFHGRSGSINGWLEVIEKLMSKVRCNVLMVSYRGYGDSTGSPDEAGMKIDAEAALQWVLEKKENRKEHIVVYGQSMGGAVAIHLASKHPDDFKYLIVENTFMSLPDVAAQEFALFGYLRYFIHQIWDSASAIKQVNQKILFLSAADDKFIPPSQMKSLSELATEAEEKVFVSIPQGGHNKVYREEAYSKAIEKFLYPQK